MTYFLDLRATDAGGMPADSVTARQDFTPIDPSELAKRVAGRDVLIGTHGFNVNRSTGITELGYWESLLNLGPTGFFVGLLWPGDSRWAPIVDYPLEGDVANKSGRLLAPFLNQNFAQATSLSFASHSLGARTVLSTIRGLNRRVRRLTLMAGAIEDDCLIDEFADAAANIDKISILASRGDTVLSYAFPVGNLLEGIITPGHPLWHAAIGHSGPQNPDPTKIVWSWQIPDNWEYRHADYLPNNAPAAAAMAPPAANLTLQGPTPAPLGVPPNAPTVAAEWKAAWSAGFVSTRFV
jgi:Alpha/beta hydrolase of unknown function (DUF900)